MHNIAVTITTTGSCAPTSIVLDQITSNESVTGFYDNASFNTTPADVAFRLKAQRNSRNTRVYTIRYRMTYDIGNGQTATAYATTTVTVTQSQGNKPVLSEAETGATLLLQNVPNPFEQRHWYINICALTRSRELECNCFGRKRDRGLATKSPIHPSMNRAFDRSAGKIRTYNPPINSRMLHH